MYHRHFVHLCRFGCSVQNPLQPAEGRCQNRQARAFNGEDRRLFRPLHRPGINRHRLLPVPAVTLGGFQGKHQGLLRGIGDASNLYVLAGWNHLRHVDLVRKNTAHLATLLHPPDQGQQGEPSGQASAGGGLDQAGKRKRDCGVRKGDSGESGHVCTWTSFSSVCLTMDSKL